MKGVKPVIHGGPQERGRRAGTENTLGIIGFDGALAELGSRRADYARLEILRERLIRGLNESISGVQVHGDPEKHLANTLSFRIEGVSGDLVLQALDLAGVYVSSGSACSSGGLEPSTALLALGLNTTEARAGLRISMGPETDEADIDGVLALLPKIVERIRSASTG
jgi:cysteine desulfurase